MAKMAPVTARTPSSQGQDVDPINWSLQVLRHFLLPACSCAALQTEVVCTVAGQASMQSFHTWECAETG